MSLWYVSEFLRTILVYHRFGACTKSEVGSRKQHQHPLELVIRSARWPPFLCGGALSFLAQRRVHGVAAFACLSAASIYARIKTHSDIHMLSLVLPCSSLTLRLASACGELGTFCKVWHTELSFGTAHVITGEGCVSQWSAEWGVQSNSTIRPIKLRCHT